MLRALRAYYELLIPHNTATNDTADDYSRFLKNPLEKHGENRRAPGPRARTGLAEVKEETAVNHAHAR